VTASELIEAGEEITPDELADRIEATYDMSSNRALGIVKGLRIRAHSYTRFNSPAGPFLRVPRRIMALLDLDVTGAFYDDLAVYLDRNAVDAFFDALLEQAAFGPDAIYIPLQAVSTFPHKSDIRK